MESLVFKQGSWHCWFANFGEKRVYQSTDICTYIRYVLIGMFLAMLCTIVCVGFVAWVTYSIYDVYNYLFMGGTLLGPTKALLLFLGMIGVTLGAVFAFVGLKVVKENDPNNFVFAAYDKFKSKTCRRVELVE